MREKVIIEVKGEKEEWEGRERKLEMRDERENNSKGDERDEKNEKKW